MKHTVKVTILGEEYSLKSETPPEHAKSVAKYLDGAIRELETATGLDAGNTAAIYTLAQASRKKGDRTRAGELLARVTKLNAQERGDDPTADLKRTVLRIVREGSK